MRSRSKTTTRETEFDELYAPDVFPGAGAGATAATTSDQYLIDRWWPANRRAHKQKTNLQVLDNMTDTVVKDYAKRRKAGEILPTNPMNAHSSPLLENAPKLYSTASALMVGPVYKSFGRDTKDFALRTRTVQAPLTLDTKSLLSERDVQTIQVDALSKLRRQGMDVLTTAAELRQTLAMIVGVRAKLVRLVVAAVRLLRNHRKYVWTWSQLVTEFASNPWLEARFGWRILYYDLLAIQKHLDQMDEGTKFIVGRSSERADLTEVRNGVTYIYTDKVKVGYPGMLDLSLPGFASVPNTMWELLTFSLVVDMFFDVQKRILAYSGSAVNVKEYHEAAFVTRTRTVAAVVQAEMPTLEPGYNRITELYEPAAVTVFASRKSRVPTTVPALGLPSFQLSLGGYKPIDLAFLTRIIISKMF